jgi:hypothetical protein
MDGLIFVLSKLTIIKFHQMINQNWILSNMGIALDTMMGKDS